jgi:ethanolamine utilization microcompartment shell protein EutS
MVPASINAIAYGEAAAAAELAAAVAATPAAALPVSANGTLIITPAEAAAIAAEFKVVAADIRNTSLSLLWHE